MRKRKRRTGAEIDAFQGAMSRVLEEVHPRTARNVCYVLSGMGLIQKTENEYNNTVIRLLTRLRKARRVPFSWLADATRWIRKPRTYRGLEHAIDEFAAAYRRDLWESLDVHVEIWTEKDAIAGIMSQETNRWDVPLLAGRGYASHSFLYNTAEYIKEIGKPACMYYFGDYDPRGLDISRFVEEHLREYAEDMDITYARVGVTREQIDRMELPTRPTKREENGFGRDFDAESVDIDTVDPRTWRAMVRACITRHVSHEQLGRLHRIEAEERHLLRDVVTRMAREQGARAAQRREFPE